MSRRDMQISKSKNNYCPPPLPNPGYMPDNNALYLLSFVNSAFLLSNRTNLLV